jgi:choice-of-anchor A domain-containing protein
MRLLSALVGICILAFASAVTIASSGRTAYICGVSYQNFCPTNAASCANDPVLHFSGVPYSMSHFNLISFGGIYAASGDTEGRIAVKGNADLTAYSTGYQLRTAGVAANSPSYPYSAVIGGNAKWNGGAEYPDGSGFPYLGNKEYIFVGGDRSQMSSYLQADATGSCPTPGCLDNDFNAAQSYYNALSAAFASVSDNAAVHIETWGTIEVTCNSMADAQYYITLSPDQFSTINYWTFTNCNPNSGLVVNIIGTGNQARFWGATQTFFSNSKVLYNIVPTSSTPTARIEVSYNGNLLAPSSVYNAPGGVFIGQVIVGDVQQMIQINLIQCPTPSPSNNHNNSQNNLCPAWETDCAGLNIDLDSNTYSLRDFNAISFGNFYADTGDVEGRLAVQGNAHFGNGFSVGYTLDTGSGIDAYVPFSLIVGGNLYWGDGELFPTGDGIPFAGAQENMFVGGTFTTNETGTHLSSRVTESCGSTPGCMDAAFNAAKSCYQGYSNNIASTPDNVQKSIEFSGLSITCNNAAANAYYVSIASTEFAQFTYTTLSNCNFQAQWFINVVGTDDVTISGASFPGIPGGTVYNIVNCGRTITVTDTALAGSFLAPCSTLNQPNGVIHGKVVAGDVTASLQINRPDTCANNVTVTIPVVVQVPSIQSFTITVNPDSAVPGDNLDSNHVVTATYSNGNVDLNNQISVVAGQTFYVTTYSTSSRTPNNSEMPSGASSVSVMVALIMALIALAF